jgi:hypothetical protein
LNDLGRATLVDPPVLTTTGPIVVTAQNLVPFQRQQGWGTPASDQNFGPTYRSTLADPPVLTTRGPIVVASPSSAQYFRQQGWGTPQSDQNLGPTYRSDLVDPPVPILGFNPIVVSGTRSARFLFEQAFLTQGVGVVVPDTRSPKHLGGTVTDQNKLGGSVTKINLGGTVVVLDPLLGGTAIVADPVNATLVEWTMQEVDIVLSEFNDETLALTLTSGNPPSPPPLNLTGLELDLFLKPAAGIPDSALGVVKLSTITGEIVITNTAGGLATASIANVDLTDPAAYTFYRVDTVDGTGKRNTAIFGKVAITPL